MSANEPSIGKFDATAPLELPTFWRSLLEGSEDTLSVGMSLPSVGPEVGGSPVAMDLVYELSLSPVLRTGTEHLFTPNSINTADGNFDSWGSENSDATLNGSAEFLPEAATGPEGTAFPGVRVEPGFGGGFSENVNQPHYLILVVSGTKPGRLFDSDPHGGRNIIEYGDGSRGIWAGNWSDNHVHSANTVQVLTVVYDGADSLIKVNGAKRPVNSNPGGNGLGGIEFETQATVHQIATGDRSNLNEVEAQIRATYGV